MRGDIELALCLQRPGLIVRSLSHANTHASIIYTVIFMEKRLLSGHAVMACDDMHGLHPLYKSTDWAHMCCSRLVL